MHHNTNTSSQIRILKDNNIHLQNYIKILDEETKATNTTNNNNTNNNNTTTTTNNNNNNNNTTTDNNTNTTNARKSLKTPTKNLGIIASKVNTNSNNIQSSSLANKRKSLILNNDTNNDTDTNAIFSNMNITTISKRKSSVFNGNRSSIYTTSSYNVSKNTNNGTISYSNYYQR